MKLVQAVKSIKMVVNQRIATIRNRLLFDSLLGNTYEGSK